MLGESADTPPGTLGILVRDAMIGWFSSENFLIYCPTMASWAEQECGKTILLQVGSAQEFLTLDRRIGIYVFSADDKFPRLIGLSTQSMITVVE